MASNWQDRGQCSTIGGFLLACTVGLFVWILFLTGIWGIVEVIRAWAVVK